jgi:hypothetical protein
VSAKVFAIRKATLSLNQGYDSKDANLPMSTPIGTSCALGSNCLFWKKKEILQK